MSYSEIARAAGMARSTVIKVAQADTWERFPLHVIDAFTRACGVDLLCPKTSMEVMLHRRMGYMRFASPAQRSMYNRILEDLRATAEKGGK